MGTKMSRFSEDKANIESSVKIEEERKKQSDSTLKTLQEQIGRCRERMGTLGGVNAARETNESVLKQIKVLESRLDKALQKFNDTVATNKDLRYQIDYLRRERAVFDNIYRKLERELQDRKKHIATMIEIANNAYNARDQAQKQMLSLKQREEEDHRAFDLCMARLTESLMEERALKNELRQIDREETLAKIAHDGHLKASGENGTGSPDNNRTGSAATGFRSDSPAGGRGPLENGINASGASRKDALEQAFAKVQTATGISDLDELVKAFTSAEDYNFSLFTFANEQSAEIERLQGELTALKSDVATAEAAEADGDSLLGGSLLVSDLQEHINKGDRKLNHLTNQTNKSLKKLSSLKSAIIAIFSRLGCQLPDSQTRQRDKNQSADGNDAINGGVGIGISSEIGSLSTELNLSQYMRLIEQRTNEILNTRRQKALQEGVMDPYPAPLGSVEAAGYFPKGAGEAVVREQAEQSRPSHGFGLSSQPGQLDMDDSDDDVRPVVMSRTQIIEKVTRDLERKPIKNGLKLGNPR